jgi:CheY-like chemotaxis protein
MIVACTGHTEDEYINKAFTHQMDEVIPKPTNIFIIKEILKELIITDI